MSIDWAELRWLMDFHRMAEMDARHQSRHATSEASRHRGQAAALAHGRALLALARVFGEEERELELRAQRRSHADP